MYLILKFSYIFVPLFRIQYLRSEAEAKAPILWPPDAKSQLTGKDPNAGKDQRQKEKGVTEDEMVRWHTDSMDMDLSKLQEIEEDRKAQHTAVHGITSYRK